MYISLYFLLLGHYGMSQKDTLYVNDTHNLMLVFPKPIQQAVTGHPNYSFGHEGNSGMRLGLIQGHPGPDSNLLVLTSEGQAYSFYLEYREQLATSHRFVQVGESIGNISTQAVMDPGPEAKKETTSSFSKMDSIHFGKACACFLKKSNGSSLKSKRKDGVILRLKAIRYFGKEVYLVMELENRSKIDFEVDFVEVFKEQGNPGRKSSYQKTKMDPLFLYQMPIVVPIGQKKRFVHVLPKFTLGDNEKVLVELREKGGGRRLVLFWH